VVNKYKWLDDWWDEIKGAQKGVNNVRILLEDLEFAFPLLGQRVMIHPDKQGAFPSDIRHQSGIIKDMGGSEREIKKKIRMWKDKDIKPTDWFVVVEWDNGKIDDYFINNLYPIHGTNSTLHIIRFTNGEIAKWNTEKYEQNIDNYLIEKGWTIKEHIKWDNDYRQKFFEEA
jgi:hypothetical protein